MTTDQHNSTVPGSAAVFGSFYPVQTLWNDSGGSPLFPSEHSARWFLKVNRKALTDAEAIALHTGRMLIDPTRCADVALQIAIARAKATAPAAGNP